MDEKIIPLTIVKNKKAKRRISSTHQNLSEEVQQLITKISEEHSNNSFGYLEKEDLKGEIWIICLEVIQEYDESCGKLEHFLRVSVKNRLVNKFKEITKSVRSPCSRCEFYNPLGVRTDCKKVKFAGTEKNPEDIRANCDKWKNYQSSVQSRNNLLNAVEPSIEQLSQESPINKLVSKEFQQILTKNIDPKLSNDLSELIGGQVLSKARMDLLREEVRKILIENNLMDNVYGNA